MRAEWDLLDAREVDRGGNDRAGYSMTFGRTVQGEEVYAWAVWLGAELSGGVASSAVDAAEAIMHRIDVLTT